MDRRQFLKAGVTTGLTAGLAACAGSNTMKTQPSAGAVGSSSGLAYPPTRIENATDGRVGVYYPNPYRWLEENTAEVRNWQRSQAELADSYVKSWPHLITLKGRTAYYLSGAGDDFSYVSSCYAAGYWYLLRDGVSTQIVKAKSLVEADIDAATVIFDVANGYGRNASIAWLSISPDGKIAAFGVVADGDAVNTIKLVDTESGHLISGEPKQKLIGSWTGGVHWLPDSSGFYFEGLTADLHSFERKIYFHQLATKKTVLEPVPLPEGAGDYTVVNVSSDGRWAIAAHRLMNPCPFAIKDLSKPSSGWKPFITDVSHTVAGFVVDDHYIAVTDLGASRGRVVSISLESTTPNDPSTWKELVTESKRVIRGLTPVADKLYLMEFLDTYARVRIAEHDGTVVGEVPLPGNGTLAEPIFPMMKLYQKGNPDEFIFSYSSLTDSSGLYRFMDGDPSVTAIQSPKVTLDNVVVEDRWATSSDGTKVPYHLVYRKDLDRSRPQPALVYGYGGFNVPWAPKFPGSMATFIEAGGIFVHVHLRGGAELGREWWEGGRLKNKQNGYRDLYAIAEAIIADGYTRSELLGVTGSSNGGLMAGVAITHRPKLWRVSVPKVPMLDIIGALRDPYGYMGCKLEYGDPEDPSEIRRMVKFSAYQLVRNGVDYPAVYLMATDTDPRTPAWHARKFGARLQAASNSENPVLIRVWGRAGRGSAAADDLELKQDSYSMAFIMRQLGMVPVSSVVEL